MEEIRRRGTPSSAPRSIATRTLLHAVPPRTSAMNPLKIGLFGIGLDAYWPQFAGLKDRLESTWIASSGSSSGRASWWSTSA